MTRFPIILLIGLIFLMSCDKQPKRLSGKIEIIEVSYCNWACSCADYIETKYYNKPNYELNADDCIFIEPSNPNMKIPDNFLNIEFILKLKGQFYLDKGIPNSYDRKTPEAPKKARVFRFDSFKLIKMTKDKYKYI
jgi:hypothetical protein